MNKLLAALFAATFALSSGAAFAQDKKAADTKKEEPKKEATTTKETKPKKGGC
jgi:Ni/Co efflux regulator RcnB